MNTQMALMTLRDIASANPNTDESDAVEAVLASHAAMRNALQLSAGVFEAIGGQIKSPTVYAAVTEALAI